MTSSNELRKAFLTYFGKHGHQQVPSGPLVPQNDDTLMFANAGMVPFKDLFTGKEKRSYTRATSSQKCIRISGKHNDLENVGVTARHQTLFEMLGNFSFGDYFKEDAIKFAWSFIQDEMKIDPERLVVTVFGGEEGYGGADEEAEKLWADVTGFGKERIIRENAKENFWTMGDTGPCGPCTEIHYFLGEDAADPRTFGQEQRPDGRGWVEIWNLVFMQFNREQPGGPMLPLPAPSVDTGMGLERLTTVKQEVLSNYDTDLLHPLVMLASELSGKKYGGTLDDDDVSMRVIADHARMAAFCISEGIFPDKGKREYVVRRVMRRAIRHGHRLGLGEPFMHLCVDKVVDMMSEAYPQLRERRDLIVDITKGEEERFRRTLATGLNLIAENNDWDTQDDKKILPGRVAFKLYDTYGFPLDLQEVIGTEQGFAIDHLGYDAELHAAKERSRGSKLGEQAIADVYRPLRESTETTFVGYEQESCQAKVVGLVKDGERVTSLKAGDVGEVFTDQTPFYAEKGGQVGDEGRLETAGATLTVTDTQQPMEGLVSHHVKVSRGNLNEGDTVTCTVAHDRRSGTRRNHSATHLLHWALRNTVGPTATQKGSMVGPSRLRFDYSATQALSAEDILKIEDMVNGAILANDAITTEELGMDDAKASGAIGIFEEKYGDRVRVLTIGPSKELCGGTHAKRTGDIGMFRILSDSGLSAGVRRIEATTGLNALSHSRKMEKALARSAALLKSTPWDVPEKTEKMLENVRTQQKEIQRLQRSMLSGGASDLSSQAKVVDGISVLAANVAVHDAKALSAMADQLKDKLSPAVILLGTPSADGKKAILVCAVSKDAIKSFKAGDIVKQTAAVVGGGGGGRPDFAQAGGSKPEKLDDAIAKFYDIVGASLA